nr:hypothetical protein [Tanacetum cinerariifolium]
MRGNQPNKFTNGGFNEFQKQTGNSLNHVETFATFDALNNVSSGYGPRCDVPFVGTSLASCSSRINGLYLDVFRKCSEFCGVKSQRECSKTFRVIFGRVLQVFSGIWEGSCVQQNTGLRGSSAFVVSVGDGNSLCGPSASLLGRSFDANLNAVTITGDSQNSYPVSRDGGNTRENSQLRRTGRRVLTNASTVYTTSIASAGTSYTYSDFGDCDRRCRYCGASFWVVFCDLYFLCLEVSPPVNFLLPFDFGGVTDCLSIPLVILLIDYELGHSLCTSVTHTSSHNLLHRSMPTNWNTTINLSPRTCLRGAPTLGTRLIDVLFFFSFLFVILENYATKKTTAKGQQPSSDL